MSDEELKQILQEEMKKEADLIMEKVNADPTLKDVKCPDSVRVKLFEQIRLYEQQKAYEQLSDEDKEFIRLGKVHKKRRKFSRYAVLAAALIAVLAFGTVSIGQKENIFKAISRIFAGEEQVVVDSDGIEPITFIEESEVYAEIEKRYGFTPVKLEYLPPKLSFVEAVLGSEIQGINIIYGRNKDTSDIIYIIRPNYREASFGTDIEDKKIQEYQLRVKDIDVMLTEYLIEDSGKNRWSVQFTYQDVQYLIRITDMNQEEVEKVINDLRF